MCADSSGRASGGQAGSAGGSPRRPPARRSSSIQRLMAKVKEIRLRVASKLGEGQGAAGGGRHAAAVHHQALNGSRTCYGNTRSQACSQAAKHASKQPSMQPSSMCPVSMPPHVLRHCAAAVSKVWQRPAGHPSSRCSTDSAHTCPHMPTHAHTCPHMPSHAHRRQLASVLTAHHAPHGHRQPGHRHDGQ